MNELFLEAYNATKKITGVDPLLNARRLVRDKKSYDVYAERLSEGLSAQDAIGFKLLAENSRQLIMENSMFQVNPYENLQLPVLRKFYPKLISKELLNVVPVDNPEPVMSFMRAYFGQYTDVQNGLYPYQFPYIPSDDRKSAGGSTNLVDLSRGPMVGINVDATTGTDDHTINIIDDYLGDLTSSDTHIEKDFRILACYDGTAWQTLSTPLYADVDGNFSADVAYDTGNSDTIVGRINFYTGVLDWQSTTTVTSKLKFACVASLEENKINTKVRFAIEKIRFQMEMRQLSAQWTIPFEQDLKSLYDINAQSELVNIIGEQIAVDTDREMIDMLIAGNSAYNDASTHQDTFYLTPPDSFTFGPKLWYENIITKLSKLSAQIYNDTQMDSANTIACNPLDAAILEQLNTFNYAGNSVAGGDLGYRSAEVQGGKWKVLVSNIVPKHKMIVKYRSNDVQRACGVYLPYTPAMLSPYPMDSTPTLTIYSRYTSKLIRPEGVAVLNINEGQES